MTTDRKITYIAAVILALGYLTALGQLDDRDRRINQMESAESMCKAVRNGEIAVQSYRDGVVECVLHTGPSGSRVAHRMEFRT